MEIKIQKLSLKLINEEDKPELRGYGDGELKKGAIRTIADGEGSRLLVKLVIFPYLFTYYFQTWI